MVEVIKTIMKYFYNTLKFYSLENLKYQAKLYKKN